MSVRRSASNLGARAAVVSAALALVPGLAPAGPPPSATAGSGDAAPPRAPPSAPATSGLRAPPGAPPSAPAEPDDAALEAAQAAVQAGQAHLKAGRYREGIAEYEKAHAALPEERHLFTIAGAWERTDAACEEAPRAWARFLAACGDCADAEAARSRRQALVARCPVRVRVATEPVGARLLVDARDAGVSPAELALAPGEHVFEATLEGHLGARLTERVVGGEAATLLLRLVAESAPVNVVEPPDHTPSWVALGGAGVGAALGTVFAVRLQGHLNDFAAAQSRAAAKSARDDADTAAVLTQVGFGLMLSGLGLSYALWE